MSKVQQTDTNSKERAIDTLRAAMSTLRKWTMIESNSLIKWQLKALINDHSANKQTTLKCTCQARLNDYHIQQCKDVEARTKDIIQPHSMTQFAEWTN